MRITIATCCHLRPKVTELFCIRFMGLKKYAMSKGIMLELCAAATDTDAETIEVLTRYNINHVAVPNERIGAKWNTAVSYALSTFPEYVCICGDDDLLLDSWVDAIYQAIGLQGGMLGDMEPFIGLRTAYVLNEDGSRAILRYQNNKAVGSGCLIRADLLKLVGMKRYVKQWLKESVGVDQPDYLTLPMAKYFIDIGHADIDPVQEFRLWPPDLRRSLDMIRDIEMAKVGVNITMIDPDSPVICAVKTQRSIWKWDNMKGADWMHPIGNEVILLPVGSYAFWYENILVK